MTTVTHDMQLHVEHRCDYINEGSDCPSSSTVDVDGLFVCAQHAVALRLERITDLLERLVENAEHLPGIANDLGCLLETMQSIDSTTDSIDWRVMPWWARCWNRVRYWGPTRRAQKAEREDKNGSGEA